MYEITIEDIKQAFLRLFSNKLLIVLITGIGLFTGLLYASYQETEIRYDATATLSVAFGQNLGPITGTTVISNYADIITSYRVSEYASILLIDENLTSEEIQKMVRVTDSGTSFLLNITARNESPRIAIIVANAVAESFVAQVAQITGSTTISVLDYSRTARAIFTDRSNTIIVLAPAAAFIATCFAIMILRLMSGKVWSLKQCVIEEGELLTVIPKVNSVNSVSPISRPRWGGGKGLSASTGTQLPLEDGLPPENFE